MTLLSFKKGEVKKRGFNTTNLQTFWCQKIESYPLIAKFSLRFSCHSSPLMKHAFFILVDFKAKKRNRLPCENDKELLFPRQSLEFYN